MFERILLPTDFSDGSQSAIAAARRIGQAWGSEIHLVHVDEERALGMHSSDDLIHFMNDVDARRKEWMESTANKLVEEGLGVELVRLEGVASDEILRYAEEQRMGLIIMGTTGHTPMEYLLLGSTSMAVLRHAPCPVLTVSGETAIDEAWGTGGVLFPTDFSAASVRGVGIVAEVATKLEAPLHLLHVLKAPTFIPAIPGEPPFFVTPSAFGPASERADTDLQALAKKPELDGLTVEWGVTIAGDTAEGITSWAKDRGCDLVVVPRHGRGAIRSILFGRVVTHVVKRSPLPVLSFHPG